MSKKDSVPIMSATLGNGTLPASGTVNSPGGTTPAGWIQITINGTTRYMPFF